jgi:hypothetical protein
MDYELMAKVDRWDGYGDPDTEPDPYDEDEAAERLAFPEFQEPPKLLPDPDIPF